MLRFGLPVLREGNSSRHDGADMKKPILSSLWALQSKEYLDDITTLFRAHGFRLCGIRLVLMQR
ncbi:hypothetical protein QWE_09530 [Agrobacterium albertimagni AOL15]|uniref:Uncharacterized protein n=1 Tax=Agrobacterium albertimagni AOL15 TaxID=1156935 RepID=K2Q3W1_9HYPH|nr:hypothetical protein QWE_09530 [Agrobacterium albertimagni AOL15]